MQFYFVEEKINNFFILNKQDEFHLLSVMRANLNNKIICVYESNHYLAKIIQIKPLKIESIEKLDTNNENSYNINLVIGLIKKTKWDLILQKATELGVDRIIPFEFQNTIIDIKEKDLLKKSKRWYNICKEAAEQSKRNKIPIINKIENKIINLNKFKSKLNIVCYENSINLIQKKIKIDQKTESLTIVIGSEGGFTNNEIDKLINLGFNDIKLSKQILRTETAVVYILSIINYILGSK